MFVLDTCVVSEFVKTVPNSGVLAWLKAQKEEDLLITTLTLGELLKGIERLPQGPKRSNLEAWFHFDLMIRFHNRIIAFDQVASFEWGRLCARLVMSGLPMPAVDSQIAAICLSRAASLVTRNTSDFVASGVPIINPWS
ncbi:MAG: type II toxin-antitoxin system VapC family toxin [Prosthecobacter sp.]|nr:type II toxin-antitoxin system VapC family toxin [Prosthecobacter sp.]